MQSLITNLKEKHCGVKVAISDLLLKHSGIESIPTREVRVRYNNALDRFMENIPFFVGPQYGRILSVGSSNWRDLDADGCRVQKKTLNLYRDYYNILSAIIIDHAETIRNRAIEADRKIQETIEQRGMPLSDDPQNIWDIVEKSLDQQFSLLTPFVSHEAQAPILVMDTNALLYNPSLEDWCFDEFLKFELVLVPTVLEEIDKHKSQHRNEQVREKAEGLVTRIKGYRNRGKLSEGVTLRKDISTLRAPPQNSTNCPLFSADDPDSRILANCFEIARLEFSHPVALVTRDVNLQNRAELYCLPFLEPPAPARM